MPAKNPRLTITLDPSLKAKLERISALTGNSQGALVSELLEGSEPVFDRLIVVLEAAVVAREKISDEMFSDLSSAQEQIEKQLGLSLDLFESSARPILKEAERVQRRGRKSPSKPRLTPPSNRGVRSETWTGENSAKSKG